MKYIYILITIISGGVLCIHFLFGLDSFSKWWLEAMTTGAMYIIFLLALCGIYLTYKKIGFPIGNPSLLFSSFS
ncbi:hypothetical protein ACFO4N_15145 [Camelliibacillus cellulosilyticus]|uniref:Uncharacterized protein n=1 Tax=Camelliibacillus cellulosilyticus TaxID=2174486 RepID=A0ABV9GPW1_9BACL